MVDDMLDDKVLLALDVEVEVEVLDDIMLLCKRQ